MRTESARGPKELPKYQRRNDTPTQQGASAKARSSFRIVNAAIPTPDSIANRAEEDGSNVTIVLGVLVGVEDWLGGEGGCGGRRRRWIAEREGDWPRRAGRPKVTGRRESGSSIDCV